MKRLLFLGSLLITGIYVTAQPQRWQQKVKYTMNIRVDADSNRFSGTQRLEYTNNSPDTLKQLFYHLYWNAFQPNSMMDARSRHFGNIQVNRRPEWDGRVRDRILHLQEDETGFQKIKSLQLNGVPQSFSVEETILQVPLSRPIPPGAKAVLTMEFEAQIPLQVRRSGRDAANGVRFSMSQWYPKLCEYDQDGWHPNPYVGREFYGVWGDFDVKITIDRKYILGGTGYLQNAAQIGYGYEPGATTLTGKDGKLTAPKLTGNTITWHFIAPNVHDFVWAADPDFKHLRRRIEKGPDIHVLYKTGDASQWEEVADAAVAVYPYIEKNFGAYPYKQYSFIQGGDGGMEYPMATLLNGPGLGTVFHEWMHSWYQMLLATNESAHAWMDEGFTEWATNKVQDYYQQTVIRQKVAGNEAAIRHLDSLNTILPRYHSDNYAGYYYLVKSGLEEPMTTHADHFESNTAYSLAAYSKGCVYLSQLGYIIGEEALDRTMLEYYRQWRYKHPGPSDFLRIAENVSGLQLDWYQEYWVNTTKTIDYGIDSVWEDNGMTNIRVKRLGKIPMPIDLLITYKDGSKELVYAPAYLMFGEKPQEDKTIPRTSQPAWKWTHPTYTFTVNKKISTLQVIEIDATQRMADIERRNNRLVIPW